MVDPQHQCQHGATDDEAGTAVTDKGQGQALGRQQSGADAHVDESLPGKYQRHAVTEVTTKGVARYHTATPYPENATDQRHIQTDHRDGTNKAGFLGPDGEHKV